VDGGGRRCSASGFGAVGVDVGVAPPGRPRHLPGSLREALDLEALIRRIVESCPRRVAGSASEREALHILEAEYQALGWATEVRPFEWNQSAYTVMALHFGLATAGTLLLMAGAPGLALLLHLVAGLSYVGDSTRLAYLLRGLLPSVTGHNLLSRRPDPGSQAPSGKPPRLRLVIMSHVDAAYTGWVFDPRLIRMATRPPPFKFLNFITKSMLVATVATLLLAVVDLCAWLGDGEVFWLALLLGLAPALTFVFNLQVVLRDEVVPGANDNLTGCAASVELAKRLADLPADVELWCVSTGAEEAATGGAFRLAHQQLGRWNPADTVVLGIDSLSNGDLRWFVEGELLSVPPPRNLVGICQALAAEDADYAQVRAFQIPSGATDALPFLTLGYDALTLGCIDDSIGAPREYHRPSDTPDNLDFAQLDRSLVFAERVARRLVAERLG
jgi:hypothetical protein